MNIEIKNQTISTLRKSLSNEQIAAIASQQLETFTALQLRLTDQLLFDQFMHYLTCRKKAIEYYPRAIVDAIIETLNEFSADKDWVKNSSVTTKLNAKLQALNLKPYSGKKVSNLLTATGFYKKKGLGSSASVFIDRNLLRQINYERNSPTERISISQQEGEL